MQLGIRERLILLNTLPSEGSIVTLRLLREFREDLSLSETEIKDLEFKQEGSSYVWDDELEAQLGPKDIEFGNVIRLSVLGAFESLDAAGTMQDYHLDLFDKFEELTSLTVVTS